MDYKKVKLSVADRIATITLADPATMNAAGVDTIIELADAFARVAKGEDGARAVILTGEGRGFCSGANLSGGGAASRPAEADGRPDAGSALESHYNPFVTLMRDFPMPIVTAVNGAAAGVGCSLALMGDLVVAAESAYFRAMEMTMLGERIPAAKALDWGLVNRVVPDADLIAEATKLAREMADGPKALGLIRKLMWQSLDAEWSAQLTNERQTQSIAGKTDDFIEGVSAFLQKRPAQFAGR